MERLVFFIKLMLLLLSFILTSFLNDDKIENFPTETIFQNFAGVKLLWQNR